MVRDDQSVRGIDVKMFQNAGAMVHGATRVARGLAAGCGLAALVASAGAGAAVAEGALDIDSVTDAGTQRVNLAGKLRMLSQRVPAAACYLHSALDPMQSRAVLSDALTEFEAITTALTVGDPALGIPQAETRRRTLAGLEKLGTLWAPLRADADLILAGSASDATLGALDTQSTAVLEVAQKLVVVINGQYANQAELLQADAMLIDVAGRQRMLSQRMSKYACLAAADITPEAARVELRSAREAYHSSLFALANGLPSVGISPPPEPEIAEALAGVVARWTALDPLITAVQDGEAVTDAQMITLFEGANAMTAEMNVITAMYAAAALSTQRP